MKTARDFIKDEASVSTWIHEDEVEQLMKQYAIQVAIAVRDSIVPLGKTNERANFDIYQFIH